jgi:tetratricopeptide (TPR) repeat protein
MSDALQLFQKAIALDPEFSAAYGMAAWCHVQRKNNGWMINRAQATAEIERLARQAGRLGKEDPTALFTGGFALAQVQGQLEAGAVMIDRALALDPNLAAAWHLSGWVKIHLLEPEAAIEHFAHAMRLSPRDPLLFGMQHGMAAAHFLASRYDEHRHGLRRCCEITQIIFPLSACQRRATRLPGGWHTRRELWHACARSIPPFPLPVSKTSCHFVGRKILPGTGRGCEEPDCRINLPVCLLG